ncbi:WD repeat-containing protein mio-B [Smittium mucronatum]|uniref:WD repeat-containing protein mio-B n=1 Tax=Smittium mucronatum TaxID=133383 RepID=A0A1R0H0V5_9FUNG|nr:WD repeat-containing protein mio-B [Smittium mucronatum]
MKSGSWLDSLQDDKGLEFVDRIVLALKYLDDESLVKYIGELFINSCENGSIEGLLVTGLGKHGVSLLKNYVDNTGDVQTAAIISNVNPRDIRPYSEDISHQDLSYSEFWAVEYRELLNKWKLFNQRCLFDINVGNQRVSNSLARQSKALKEVSSKPVSVKCTFCRKGLGHEMPTDLEPSGEAMGKSPLKNIKNILNTKNSTTKASDLDSGLIGSNNLNKTRRASRYSATSQPVASSTPILYSRPGFTHCPKCSNKIVNCSVCRMSLGTPDKEFDNSKDLGDLNGDSALESWFSWCQNCGHGGHYKHILSWFSKSRVCAVPDCNCNCRDIF